MKRILIAAAFLWTGLSSTLFAQEPTLRPLSEHLESFASDSLGVSRYVARRCAALYAIVSGITADRSPELSAGFDSIAPKFLAMAAAFDRALGASEADAMAAVQRATSDIALVYRERLRRTMALSGSYFADDPLIADVFRVCSCLWSG